MKKPKQNNALIRKVARYIIRNPAQYIQQSPCNCIGGIAEKLGNDDDPLNFDSTENWESILGLPNYTDKPNLFTSNPEGRWPSRYAKRWKAAKNKQERAKVAYDLLMNIARNGYKHVFNTKKD